MSCQVWWLLQAQLIRPRVHIDHPGIGFGKVEDDEGQEHGQLTIPTARIVAHTEHDAEQIAAAIGAHPSTVRRHLREMRGA
ncbi:hypothetical protein [Nocardiopsis sp. ATB16-24]|uniref:hypothetical protein n=1 Tax=Nocardiopsis sp. ATB16-24 TaxID=3019555 RepID=UPI0025543A97|nr:hypothetical protein [Nocardiopsis sp. ATB16-24]